MTIPNFTAEASIIKSDYSEFYKVNSNNTTTSGMVILQAKSVNLLDPCHLCKSGHRREGFIDNCNLCCKRKGPSCHWSEAFDECICHGGVVNIGGPYYL